MPRRHDLLIAVAPPETVPDATVVVAVTAAAVHALTGLGTRPVVVDDVVDRAQVLGSDDAYVRWQLGWFDRLDAANGADGAVVASAQKLKPVVDSLIIAARLADALVSQLDPSSIEVLTASGAEDADPLHAGHLQFWPKLGDAPLWGEIMPVIGAARDVPVTLRMHPCPPSAPVAPAPLTDRLKASVAARTGTLRHFDITRWRPRSTGGTTLMLWGGGYGARQLVEAERAAGRRVVALERGGATTRLYEPVPWGRRSLTSPVPVAPLPHQAARSGSPELHALVAEIDEQAGVPGVGRLLEPRLDAFLNRIVPRVRSAAIELADDIGRLGVDAIVVANPSSIEEFAALLAGGRLGIERTLAQHGDHMFSYDGWFVSELPEVDQLLTSDATLLDDLPAAASRLGVPAPAVRPSEHRGGGSGASTTQGGPVCYVPAVLMGDTALRPSIYFDDAWYHRWHLELLGWMRDRPDMRFIWKGLPGGDHVVDPIVDAVAAVPNVDYVSQPFPWVLGQVSRVFTDFASTPAYESRRAGRSTMLLWFPRFAALRPAALADFGDAVRTCSDGAEALGHLSAWI